MKIYRTIDYEQQVDGNEIAGKNGESCNYNQQPNHSHTGTASETQFVARMIALPLLQEGLSNTQSMASRSRLGRALLDRTHLMIQRFSHTIHRVQETSTYQYYFQQDGYLQQSLIRVDGWACSSLDIIEANLPLLRQPGVTMMDSLIIKPRQQLNDTWDLVITRPLERLNGSISNKLDRAEHWMKIKNRKGVDATDDDDSQGTDIHRRILLLGGSALRLGLNQARMVTKEQYAEWIQPLVSQEHTILPLTTFLKSRFGGSVPDWNPGTPLTTKTNSTHCQTSI